MTTLMFALVLASQIFVVGGQVMLKRGLNLANLQPRPIRAVASRLAGGIALLTAWFLLWMGLLQKVELSQLYPFEGLSPVLLVLAARLILHETLTWRTWIGVLLIALGTVLVGIS